MTSFKNFLATFDLDVGIRGKQFERFVKWFLKKDPLWSSDVKQIWLWSEYPDRWGKDCGIDLVFKHKNGEIWAVQAKCYDSTYAITKADVDTFLSESGRHGIDKRLLIATTDLISSNAKQVCDAPQAKEVTRFMLSHFESSALEYPKRIEDLDKPKKKKIIEPRPHQIEAISSVAKQFKKTDRGQLIMACGTGKTYTTLWVKEKLAAQNTLVLLPSLGLLSQTLREWTSTASKSFLPLCVCSDQSVGKKEEDESIVSVADLGFPVTSDVKEIQKFIKAKGARVIFSTYQSSPLIAEAQKNKKIPAFDLVIADEAHRCAGKVGTDFSTVLDNKLIRADKRLFATATPRVYSAAVKTAAEGRGVEMVGMDDETLFGKVLYSLPFGKAISKNLLTDYQVIIIGVDNPMIAKWIKDRELLAIDPKNTMDAQALASQIGLLKAINDYDLKRVISFHSRVNRADSFVHDIQKVAAWVPKKHRPAGKLITDFVSGTMPTDKRRQKLERLKILAADERGILSNARCLSEGFDVPSLDGVAFIDPRASQVDIIQAVGRAIRLCTNKKIGTIVLPVFIEDGANAQASIEASNFKPIWDVLYALKAHDDVLSQELDQARTALGKQTLTKRKQDGLSKIIVDLPASVDSSFSNALKTYLVERITESWHFWYGLLIKYIGENGHSRVPGQLKYENFNLGAWVNTQRQIRSKLDLNKIKLLESLPQWSWVVLEDQWNEAFEYLKKYVIEVGHSIVPARFKYNEFNLGAWVSRRRHEKNNLSPERIKLLESLPKWFWGELYDQWDEGIQYLKKYIKETGHSRVENGFKYEKFDLGKWVATLKRNRNKLSEDKIMLIESFPQWAWVDSKDQWKEGYEYLKKFVDENGHAKVPDGFIYKDFKLSLWVSNQRRAREKLSSEKIILLEALPKWTWDVLSDQWNEAYKYLLNYVKEFGDSNVPARFKYENFNLGTWVFGQRYKRNKLSKERIQLLEALPHWFWPLEDQWNKGYKCFKKFITINGHARVLKNTTIDGFKLGAWVCNNRHGKNKLDENKIKLLESIPQWTWGALEDQWHIEFEYLKKFASEFGHSKVPVRYEYSDFKLGSWVVAQRKRKNKLTSERIKMLESLPNWSWDVLENQWEKGLGYLKMYISEFGSAKVPAKVVYNDFKLGSWVSEKRKKKNSLSPDRIKVLESLPQWTWSALEDKWTEGFESLKKYVKEFGHSKVPARLNYNGFNLGKWVSHRRNGKDILSPERIQMLDSLPHWTWEPLEDLWNKGYENLKKFITEFGHAKVPREFNYGDFNLGKWVSRRRNEKVKLSPERIKILESLPGWYWVTKEK